MKNENKLELLLSFLSDAHNIKIKDIIAKLDMVRYEFDNARNSNRDYRRLELMKRILDSYSDIFPEGEFEPDLNKLSTDEKYVTMLEREYQRALKENEELKQLLKRNNELIEKLLNKL